MISKPYIQFQPTKTNE